MGNFLIDWYNEFGGPSEITKDDFFLKASVVEIILFYLSLLSMLVLCITVWCSNAFHWKFILFFIPLLIWMFLRSSRKDMQATANWIAGIFGAMGGAALVILGKMILK